MKALKVRFLAVLASVLVSFGMMAQINLQPDLQYFRDPGYNGLNVFETPKETDVVFEGLKVRVGGDFALQFQGINHSNVNGSDSLVNLGANVNLPTANLNIDVQLHKGVRMHLRTYLSSRHHVEAWVKGGYIQIDRLDFIQEDLWSGFMDLTTFRVGMNDINYGDAHFRRSDNAMAIYNPFVGNYIMDAFTTEPFFEVMVRPSDFIIVAGITNGKLNQSAIKSNGTEDYGPSFYGKLGWDSQVNDDTRLRFTGSVYSATTYNRGYLYGGDRSGSRYYNVMERYDNAGGSDFSGRFNPGFQKYTSIQINPFVKFKGLEFFGIYELSSGDLNVNTTGGSVTQLGAELLYRFGSRNQLYVGGRYNSVSGKLSENASDLSINRIQGAFGWFMTDNILMKLEYVTQDYGNDYWMGSVFQDGNFNGVVLEAVVGF
jgi:hypothetical protein